MFKKRIIDIYFVLLLHLKINTNYYGKEKDKYIDFICFFFLLSLFRFNRCGRLDGGAVCRKQRSSVCHFCNKRHKIFANITNASCRSTRWHVATSRLCCFHPSSGILLLTLSKDLNNLFIHYIYIYKVLYMYRLGYMHKYISIRFKVEYIYIYSILQ